MRSGSGRDRCDLQACVALLQPQCIAQRRQGTVHVSRPGVPQTPSVPAPGIRNRLARRGHAASPRLCAISPKARIWLRVNHVPTLDLSHTPSAPPVIACPVRIIRTGTGLFLPPSASTSALAGYPGRTGRHQPGGGIRHRQPRSGRRKRLLPPDIHTPSLGR